MKEKNIKDIARIISCTTSPQGSGQLASALAIYFEDETGFPVDKFKELSNSGLNREISEKEWAYTPTSTEDRMDAITKSNIRMKLESGFGVPNDEWERQRCMLNNGED